MKKYYITTPIYYVNDKPHIGHAYTTIAADIAARWKKLQGFDVFFLTGTDEHGAKIVQSAQAKGKTPKELCDETSQYFKDAWSLLNIDYSGFIRTTDQKHEKTVQLITQKLFDKQLIYKKQYEGLYCVHCEKFLAEKDLDENGCCPDHKKPPVIQSEENYFFKLSDFTEKLISMIEDPKHPQHLEVLPEARRNEILGKLRLGLEDISISRANLQWGIPLPFDATQTVYVWVDALINYISAIGYSDDTNTFEKYWPAEIHLMAKDILWFHSVIWPAILMGAGIPVHKSVYSHGFFTINGEKMSKTIGNIITPKELVDKFGTDASRYLAVSLIPFGPDGDISMQALSHKYNIDLANNLGNLISRTNKMTEKYFEGKIPDCQNFDDILTKKVAAILENGYGQAIESMQFHKAAEIFQQAITLINQQIENDAPWKLAKTDTVKLAQCLFSYFQSTALIAMYIAPFMPALSKKIWTLAGADGDFETVSKKYFADKIIPENGFCPRGNKIGNFGIMFPRIETDKK
jgi:methionyl-tRNA synthetase